MRETEQSSPTDPFLQGDILRLIGGDEQLRDPPYGIVINADCDLAHCKIDGVVSYIPLFPFAQYFQKFWVPAFLERRERELLNVIIEVCGLELSNTDAIRNWIREDQIDSVVSKICSTYSLRAPSVQRKVEELAAILKASTYDFPLLCSLFDVQGLNRTEALAKYGKLSLRTIGDGHFVLNEVIGISEVCFVARMRRIYSINSDHVFPSVSEFRVRSPYAESYAIRIAKLTDLYRFRAAQIFAQQFSRIGLPDDITSLHETAVEAAMLSIGGQDG